MIDDFSRKIISGQRRLIPFSGDTLRDDRMKFMQNQPTLWFEKIIHQLHKGSKVHKVVENT